jgi:hypothetical protein
MFPFEEAYGIEPLFSSDEDCANRYTKAAFILSLQRYIFFL